MLAYIKTTLTFIVTCLLLSHSIICFAQNKFPKLTGPYLGQTPPGITPEIFAPRIISSDTLLEMGCAWMHDGKEFYFSRSETSEISSNWAIWVVRQKGDSWLEPEIASFSGVYRDFAPFITPDGQYLLFYRMSSKNNEVSHGTWILERIDDEWSEPRFFLDKYSVSTIDFKKFYYSTEHREASSRDIAVIDYSDGIFSNPRDLIGDINTKEFEAHSYISSDGKYMLFDRADSTYVSFLNDDFSWSKGYNLGGKFHIPSLSPGGKFLFFESKGDLYWVDAKVIEVLKPKKLK
jgi:hypothetical protein